MDSLDSQDSQDSEISTVEDVYVVESIMDKREDPITGAIDYFLKWKGYSHAENTWEPLQNLDCLDLIKEFEEKRVKVEVDPLETSPEVEQSPTPLEEDDDINGFERGYEAEEIVGATDTPGFLLYLMKWVGDHELEIVSASEANIKCPKVALKFYEDHLNIRGVKSKNLKRSGDVDLKADSYEQERQPLKKIYSLTETDDGELAFIVQKKNKDVVEIMRECFVKAFHIQMLISFYQERLSWRNKK